MDSQLTIALHILGFLASRDGEALTSEVLARTYGTSPVVLRRVLAKLQRAGLVETRRGVGGGSVLAREATSINLRDAYEAVVGEPRMLRRHPGGRHTGGRHTGGRHTGDRAVAETSSSVVAPILARFVNGVFAEAEQALLAKLEAVTVAEMDSVVRDQIRAALHCAPAEPRKSNVR